VSRQFASTGSKIGEFREFKAWTDSFSIYLYVDQGTGIWKHQKYQPLR